jgi:membrane fusion protein, multidrug efflux system
LLVFLTGSGCRKASAPQQGPLPVNVVTVVEKEVNEWDEFTGRLDPVESVEIRPRVPGYITEIHFEAGAEMRQALGTAVFSECSELPASVFFLHRCFTS